MMPPASSSKRILILYATAGAGHKKAAEAVFAGLKSRGVGNVDFVDALDHTSSFFKKTYSDGYEFMVGKLPKVWAISFALTDQAWFAPIFRSVRRIYNYLNARPLVRFIRNGNYDVIFTTHFLSTEVVGWMRRKGMTDARFITMVTDYDVHRIWLVEGVDQYLVASDYTKGRLKDLGVEEGRVAVTGIPVAEKFIQPRDKRETRRRLGLQEDRFTVLLSTSSFGFGPIEELTALLSDIQMIVICGYNKGLFERMTARGNPLHKICTFVDNMEEMLAASDVMITKPGGLSITEALANHLPLIFFSAIPGQEAGNVRVLAANGIGMSDKTPPEIAAAIRAFADSPEALQKARDAATALARPDSVAGIVKEILKQG